MSNDAQIQALEDEIADLKEEVRDLEDERDQLEDKCDDLKVELSEHKEKAARFPDIHPRLGVWRDGDDLYLAGKWLCSLKGHGHIGDEFGCLLVDIFPRDGAIRREVAA